MRVFVTGGAGYIGSHTCKLLSQIGHEPIVFDNLTTGHAEFARYGPLIEGDICDATALEDALKLSKPAAVIHFAASAYIGESVQNPRKYYHNNVVGTYNLLDAMRQTGIENLVFSSSCATYGIPSEAPISETTCQEPINPYGRTKFICELMMRDFAEAGELNCFALRYFNAAEASAAGELGEAHDPETHVIPLILQAIRDGSQFQILGDDYPTLDGTCIRDYLHVEDLARAHVLALEKLSSRFGFRALNLGSGTGFSVRQLIEAAQKITGGSLSYFVGPKRAGDPPVLISDPTKASLQLGWSAQSSSIETIIGSAWTWMQSSQEKHSDKQT